MMYLPNKGWIIAVFEVLRENFFGEFIFINHNKAYAASSPLNWWLIVGILQSSQQLRRASHKFFSKNMKQF